MYAVIHSTTRHMSRDAQRPTIVAKSDYKSSIVRELCDGVTDCLASGARVFAHIPNEGNLEILPANNVYALISAIDRGCDHVSVDLPGTAEYLSCREHFVIAEI